jgi:serine/threonine-protein kinase
VPDVVGDQVDTATDRLRSAGFEVRREDARSDEVEVDRVIRQDPAEGTRQIDGGTITITVSIGAGTLRLPNVVSLTEFGATQDLQALGLEVRRENREDTTLAEGLIIEQSPAAGAEVEQGSTVILTVSQGSPLVALPDVNGLEREQAETLLNLVGCTVTDVLSEESAEVTAGQAVRTDPAAGTGIDPESCGVVLVMSTGAGAQDPNAPVG